MQAKLFTINNSKNNTKCVAKNKVDDYPQPRFQNVHKKEREKKIVSKTVRHGVSAHFVSIFGKRRPALVN